MPSTSLLTFASQGLRLGTSQVPHIKDADFCIRRVWYNFTKVKESSKFILVIVPHHRHRGAGGFDQSEPTHPQAAFETPRPR